MDNRGKIIVISGPSGVGKTTIYKHILEQFQQELSFSISATTRLQRSLERHGEDYYFISVEEFQQKIKDDKFIEWEQVHKNYYGTLKTEIERIWSNNKIPLLDLDVNGGLYIKEKFGIQAYLIFISPPSIEVLEERIRFRGENCEETIQIRLQTAEQEMFYKDRYDIVLVNKELSQVVSELNMLINNYIK